MTVMMISGAMSIATSIRASDIADVCHVAEIGRTGITTTEGWNTSTEMTCVRNTGTTTMIMTTDMAIIELTRRWVRFDPGRLITQCVAA